MSEVARLAQSGDQDAFERLYRENVGRIYALCLRLSGDAVHAQSLTQDVFVRAWEKLPSFRGESAFSSWLHRLAVNVVLSGRRVDVRRERRVTITDDLESVPAAGTREAPAGLALDLERAIAGLPPGARAVFVLHDIEGYEHQEIAEMTGIATGTSKAHLFRARRLLREALDR
ncbi:MAG: RNA polymerase sigma factor [Gemmatimonadetes bacterium]|nr:RNA polymerase sigma factor [Gemmatimonadota bacterium]